MELLVKVQQQHDQFIFDKLTKMIKEKESPNARRTALGLFGHIIRKHPTWIHKVVDHQLMKEVMKLLKVSLEADPDYFVMSNSACSKDINFKSSSQFFLKILDRLLYN